MRKSVSWTWILVAGVLASGAARASDDGLPPEFIRENTGWNDWQARIDAANAESLAFEKETPAVTITPLESFLRTEAVLDHFGVPAEPDSQPLVQDLSGYQSAAGVARILPYLDRDRAFPRIAKLEGGSFKMFRDRDGFSRPDYEIPLAADGQESGPVPVAVGHGSLAGLRIALDPGHMGGD
ncbi:MAG TPA: hypothetical protein VL588_12380, partial [Bdellovibrionota bacterium]|nr:hypothetical protein [Bdellovibrionota bacterium]